MKEDLKSFNRIVVAKRNIKNGCYATEGDVLIVKPRRSVPKKTVVPHSFVSATNGELTSKFGWVKEVIAFSLAEFLECHLCGKQLNPEEIEQIRIMLESVQSLPEGTPVSADYRSRGVIERSMQLTVHKVIFYKG